ncbi:MAG: glycosyltransferase family 39 protein [Ignavibacteria bacterium]|nr:glycosyltransferase family 39 protein [Ignavibacteria bacterium]
MNKKDIFFISLSAFILCNIILIFNIEKGEVQPWDEGLYAYRAREILKTDKWWDQVDISLGGLYSATYPPLVPWAIALNMKIFGVNLFSIRLFSVLCSSLLVFFFIFFFSRCFDYQIVFLLGLNILLSSNWIYYSRQGMTDIPLLLFIISNIFANVKFLEATNKKDKLFFGILISFTFFLSLMTKIVLSFIPIIALLFTLIYFNKSEFKRALIFYVIGFVCAFPWYAYMGLKYGWTFLSSLIPPHLFTPVEGNIKSLGFLYYFNQLIVSNPLIIFAFLYVLLRFKRFTLKTLFITNNYISDIFFFWFLVGTVIFTLAPTKLPHYTLYLILPGFYLALEYFSIHYDKQPLTEKFLIFILLLLSVFWYLSPSFRQSIQSFHFNFNPILLTLLILSLIVTLLIFFYEKNIKEEKFFTKKSLSILIYLFTISILVFTIIQFSLKPTGKIFGGEKTAKFLLQNNIQSFVYLFHFVNNSDTLNPQLAWYTNGFYFKRSNEKKVFFIPIPQGKIGLEETKKLQLFPDKYIVYYSYSNKIQRGIVFENLIQDRKIVLITPNYIVFGKIGKKSPLIEEIKI